MSRFKVLRANPRRTLAALATLLIAVGVTAASGASFSSQTVNPTNTFTSGTLNMTNSKAGAAILTASLLKPGGPAQTGQVTITNTGNLGGDVKLSKTALTESDTLNPISGKLNMIVTDCGPDAVCGGTGVADDTNKYTGTLAAMSTTNVFTTTYTAGMARKYEFSVALDSSALNPLQGKTATAEFTWDLA
jgi:spore coat-associated protein N